MCFVPSLVPPILGPNTGPYGSSFASDARGWTASGTGGSDMAICKLYMLSARKNPPGRRACPSAPNSSYTNNTDTVITDYDPIDMLDALVGQAIGITAVQDSNQFKLMLKVENPVIDWKGGVMYTGWNGGKHGLLGVLSGIMVLAGPTSPGTISQ